MAHPRARWLHLLQDPDVKRWHRSLARGALATADVYLRALGRFLDGARPGLTPKGFVELPAREAEDLLGDFIDHELERKCAGSYVVVYKKSVASWLAWNGRKLQRPIKVPGAQLRPTLRDAVIPDQDRLRGVLAVADARARTAVGLMAFAGCRPEILGNHLGKDGLRLRDLVDLEIRDGDVVLREVPLRIVVPPELSKIGRPFFTFLGDEGCEYLEAYLRERMTKGEPLGPNSPAITPKWAKKPFMRTINISDLIRKPMRAAGLKEPPYILRSYFSSRAMLAEIRGFLRDYKEFFMGHTGDIGHVYALHKQLPPDTIEAMRHAYQAGLEFLETRHDTRRNNPVREMVRVLLETAGLGEEEIDDLDLNDLSHSDLAALLQEHAFRAPDPRDAGPRQKTIPAGELDDALSEGWNFRHQLHDGRILVEAGSPD